MKKYPMSERESQVIRILIFAAFIAFLLAPLYVRADWFGHHYWVPSGTKKVIAWTAEPGAIGYELQIRRMENGKTVYQARVVATQKEITWKTPGHYVVYVRWYKLVDGVNTFGEWKNSLEPDSSLVLVGGEWTPRAWVIIVPTIY
jgi:hypothetical protein